MTDDAPGGARGGAPRMPPVAARRLMDRVEDRVLADRERVLEEGLPPVEEIADVVEEEFRRDPWLQELGSHRFDREHALAVAAEIRERMRRGARQVARQAREELERRRRARETGDDDRDG